MGISAIDKLEIKLGGLPPWLAKKTGGGGGTSPAGPEGKKTDPKKPHSFIPGKDDAAKCSVCGGGKDAPLHAKTTPAKKPGGNPFGNNS